MEHLMRIVKQALVLALLCPVFPGLARSADVDVEKLSAYISKAREDWAVPGLAVAIVKDGKVALARGYGVRELGGDKPVDADTLFAIASNSKAFTSAAIATLVEDGKLGWNDRLLGSMLLAEEAGVVPSRLSRGASIALEFLCQEKGRDDPAALLDELWEGVHGDHRQEFQKLILGD